MVKVMNQKEKTQSRVFVPLRHFTEKTFLNKWWPKIWYNSAHQKNWVLFMLGKRFQDLVMSRFHMVHITDVMEIFSICQDYSCMWENSKMSCVQSSDNLDMLGNQSALYKENFNWWQHAIISWLKASLCSQLCLFVLKIYQCVQLLF